MEIQRKSTRAIFLIAARVSLNNVGYLMEARLVSERYTEDPVE